MKRTFLVHVFALLFCFAGCQNDRRTHIKKVSNDISDTLTAWHFFTGVKATENKKIATEGIKHGLHVEIQFHQIENNPSSSFFFSPVSNEILIHLLNETFYHDFIKYESIEYTLIFDSPITLDDGKELELINIHTKIPRETIEENHRFNLKNKSHYNFLVHVIKNFRNKEISTLEAWIQFHNDETELINFEGNFWNLMDQYFKACNNQGDFPRKAIYNFMVVATSACYTENNTSPIDPKKFSYLLDYCGLSSDLVKLPLIEMIEELKHELE